MTARRIRILLLLVALPAWPGSAPAAELRGLAHLARVYDAILDARFDQAETELRAACGPAPPEACHVLDATSLWWQILLDPGDPALDEAFSASVERAIRTSDAWTERDPADAEAWFYRGGAYAARVQWHVLRGQRLAAARDGRRILQSLERAVALRPGLDDAYFGIGMYKYYADVAPRAARILRFLLLLPGGNRQQGLEEMLRARDRGRLMTGEADYQLHLIYLWYEQRTEVALSLLRGLREQYPGNPLFLMQIAEIEEVYLHDRTASLSTWRALLAAAREQRVNAAGIGEVRARLAVARQLDALYQTDDATEQLEAIVAAKPRAPHGALAEAYLRLGEARDRLGQRAQAVAAYRSAAAAAPPGDPADIKARAGEGLRRSPDVRRAEAYRLSLEGWRQLEQKNLPSALSSMERAIGIHPADPVARYRYGRVLQALRRDADALEQFESAIREARAMPPSIAAAAYLDAARLFERAGDLGHARAYYHVAATYFGAAEDTHAAAARALARLDAR